MVTCSVHVNRGTGHMLGWDQRTATRTGVESSSDLELNRGPQSKVFYHCNALLLPFFLTAPNDQMMNLSFICLCVDIGLCIGVGGLCILGCVGV